MMNFPKGKVFSINFVFIGSFECITKGYRKKENDKGRINLVSELFYTPRGDSSTINPQSFPLINFHQAINTNIINNSGVKIEDENFYKFEIIRTRLCL